MRLGFDIDCVVCDIITPLITYINNTYDLSLTDTIITKWNFNDVTFSSDPELNDIIKKDAIELVNDREFQANALPYPEAVRHLQIYYKLSHSLHYISARPNDKQDTVLWLRKHGIPFDTVDTKALTNKGMYGKKYELDCYVDDYDVNLESMYEVKHRWRKGLVLMNRPWNRHAIDESKFKRVDNWGQLDRHLGIINKNKTKY